MGGHGLFKATGHASTPIPRVAQDFYRTPPDATRAFLRAEERRLRSFPAIWEPAAGDGWMCAEIIAAGHNIIASDITDRFWPGIRVKDFLDYTEPLSNCIITNPPYSLVNWRDGRACWIRHALGVLDVEYMALLLPWSWPAAAGLGPTWEQYPPAVVYLMTWKLDFTNQGAPPSNHCWVVWDRGHRGETIMRRLDKREKQGRML